MLKQLRDFKFSNEQEGKLCFIQKSISIDEGEEDIYVIGEVQDEISIATLHLIDAPNRDEVIINFRNEDIFIMNAAYIVNRVTEWK